MTKDLIERAVSRGNIPQRLYKYRAIDTRTFDALSSASMWFASPLDFNDPFDFQIVDAGSYSTADIKAYLEHNRLPAADVDKIISAGVSPGKLSEIVEQAKRAAFARKGVLCLSGVPDAILMWSHYSLGHTGLAFELDVLADPEFFATPIQVHYSRDYPRTQYLVEGTDAVLKCIRTKASDWEYEKEVRIIKNVTGLQPFKRQALTGVYVGCRTSSAHIDSLSRHLADGGYSHTALYQASRADSSYRITFRRL